MNVNIVIYNTTTGEVDRVCNVAEEDAALQVQGGESYVVIDDPILIADMYQGNYKKYRITSETVTALPPQPTKNHVFDYGLGEWIDRRSLDSIKSDRWELIKTRRERVIDAKLDTPYGQVDSRSQDRVNITNAVMMLQTLAGLGTPGTVQFTMADNSTVELDVTKMVHIGLLLGQKTEAAHATARVCREAIAAAQTIEEVLAVTWS